MSPRPRTTPEVEPSDGETPPVVNPDGLDSSDGVQAFAVQEMEPPARTRAVKHVLSNEQLHAFSVAIVAGKWAGTGETFNGEEGEKGASNTARVWRRELARYLGCEEREIRTRIWETSNAGHYTCAVKLRDGSKVTVPENAPTTGEPSDDTPDASESGESGESASDESGESGE